MVTVEDERTEVKTLPPAVSLLQIYNAPYTDSTGVPLSSDRAEPELIADIDFEYRKCPFDESPSRLQEGQSNPMLMSDFERKRLAENYLALLSITGQIRDRYIDSRKDSGNRPLTPIEIRSLLRGLFFLPHYLVNIGDNPIPVQGTLHPAIINLSNSASGSLGAIEAYLETYGVGKNLFMAPDPDKMIEESEKSGAMVGDKTICVASPNQMRHFFLFLINGPQLPTNHQFELSSFFDLDETPNLLKFGSYAYEAHDLINTLKCLDRETAKIVSSHVRHNPRRYRIALNDFLQLSRASLPSLMIQQEQINRILGRSSLGPKITLETLEAKPMEFQMPALLRRLKISSN